MQTLREFVLSYLNKHPVLYTFNDSAGLISEILYSVGVVKEKRLTIDVLFDSIEKSGRWNQMSFGSIAFYGESCSNLGRVGFLLDNHLILTTDASTKGLCVSIKPLKWRSDLVAVIKPDYSSIGWIT